MKTSYYNSDEALLKLIASAKEMEEKQSTKSKLLAQAKELDRADSLAATRINRKSSPRYIDQSIVTHVAARGGAVLVGSQKAKKNTSVHFRFTSLTDAERVERGLTVRYKNVDYRLRELDGNLVKTCACCNETFAEKNFSKSKNTKDGYNCSCKDCDSNRKKAGGEFNIKMRLEDEANNVEKVCTSCIRKKPITDFGKAYTSFRGSNNVCKCCISDNIKAKKLA